MKDTRRRAPRRPRLIATLLAVASLVASCGDDGTGPGDGIPAISSYAVLDSDGPMIRSLSLELEAPAAVQVFYEPVAGGRTFRMTSADTARSHDILMPRLRADTEYRFAARTLDGATPSDDVVRGTFTTGSLPADLETLGHTVEGEGTFELLRFGHRVDGGFAGHIAMEADGAIVWYTEAVTRGMAATPRPGSPDMLIINREGQPGVLRVSPRGDVVAFLDQDRLPAAGLHHDIAALDEHRVVMIVDDVRTVRDTAVYGEGVWLWDMETDEVEQVWSAWDHLDWDNDRGPRSRPDDWLHANAISVGPRGNLIVSFHYLNQVISIAPDFGSVEWRLGGTNATIPVAEEARFEGQHSAFELENGNILLFDNRYRDRSEPPSGYSRGLELVVGTDSARTAWEYVPDPAVWARIISGIYDLENGHRLVTFATPPDLFTVHEADETGQRVWRLTGDALTVNFRAVPWPSIAGEEVVDGMP